MPSRVLALCLLVACLLVAPARAQRSSHNPLPIAALVNGDIWLFDFDGRGVQFTNDARTYTNLTWSPDGSRLAGIISDGGQPPRLFITDFSGAPLIQLDRPLPAPAFPISFSADGSQLIFASDELNSGLAQVYRFAPVAGAAPEPFGGFQYRATCGSSAARIPHEQVLNAERGNGWFLEGHSMLLAMLPFGLLHNTDCVSNDLWVLNPANGQDTQLFSAAENSFISPEQARAIVVVDGVLTFVNTERGPYTQIAPAAPPDQVGFGLPDSSEVFYSTRAQTGATPLTDGVAAQLGDVFFNMPMSYEVSIHRFSLRTGRDETLYAADAYGIGRLTRTADGGTLLFSQIPNPDAWVQALANGTLAANDLDGGGRYAQPDVYALSLADNSTRLLGAGWHQYILSPAYALPVSSAPAPVAPPPTATYPPTLTPGAAPAASESGLSIGAQVTISGEITALNVRRSPGTGSSVVQIVTGGEQVTILDGPVDMEGFRWWQVELASGAVGWVAEYVNGVQTLED